MTMEMPIITLQMERLAETMRSAVMLRDEDVATFVNQGLDKAIKDAKETLLSSAAKAATNAIERQIESYFRYGEGAEAIKKAVEESLRHVTESLNKGKPCA